MKSLLTGIVVILFLSFTLPGAILAQSGILEGTWEVVSAKTTAPDGTVSERTIADPDDKGGSIRIINATHFAVVGYGKDGSFGWATAGTYTVEGNTYTEFVTKAADPSWVGWVNPAEFVLEGDLMKTKRTNSDKYVTEETWRRLKLE